MNKLMHFGLLYLLSVMVHVTGSYTEAAPPPPRRLPPPVAPRPPPPFPNPGHGPVRTPPPTPVITPDELPQVVMLDVGYVGNGCPNGSLVSVMSPDQQVVSLLFNEFISQAGPSTGLPTDRKVCQINIPLQISNGRYQAMITRVDFRGLASLPAGALMHAQGSYNLTSPDYPNIRPQSFSVLTNKLMGPRLEDYYFSVVPIEQSIPTGRAGQKIEATKWSACSNRLNMTIQAQVAVQNNPMQADALGSVDSIDATVSPGIEYQMQWRRCR